MSDGKESHSVYSSAPLSPMRSEEFDYQQSNITLLKVLWGLGLQYTIYDYLFWFIYRAFSKPLPFDQAQLKLVTHERDNLKKDVKRISQVKFMRKTEVTVNNWPLRSVMVRIDISPYLLLRNLHLRRQLLTIALTLTLLPPWLSQVSPYSKGFAKSKPQYRDHLSYYL